jgi:hypothetical protein
MKDENDAQTIGWVDEEKVEQVEVLEGAEVFTLLASNPPLGVALNNLIVRTINDITEKQA